MIDLANAVLYGASTAIETAVLHMKKAARREAIAEALGAPQPLRTYRVRVRGYPDVFVRARSRSRAKSRVASAYAEAYAEAYAVGFKDGLQRILGLKHEPKLDAWPLVHPQRGPEGEVRRPDPENASSA